MVKFSCFPTHHHHHRTKKPVEQHAKELHYGLMPKELPRSSQVSPSSASSNFKMEDNNLSKCNQEQTASASSFDCCWKSEDLNGKSCTEDDKDSHQRTSLKKSQSMGSGLDRGLSSVIEGQRLNSNQEQTASASSFDCCWTLEDLNGKSCTEDDKDSHQRTSLKKSQNMGSGLDRGFSSVIEDDLGRRLNSNQEQTASASPFDCCWKSEDLNGKSCTEVDKDSHQRTSLKKSQSMGSGLDRGLSSAIEDDLGRRLSFDNSNESLPMIFESFTTYVPTEVHNQGDYRISFLNQNEENASARSSEANINPTQHESIFPIRNVKQLNKLQHEDIKDHSSTEQVDLGQFSWNVAPTISRSDSSPHFPLFPVNDGELSAHELMHRSRSLQNLSMIHMSTQILDGHREFYHITSSHQSRNPSCSHEMPSSSNLVESKTPSQVHLLDGDVAFMHDGTHTCNSRFDDTHDSRNLNISNDGWKEPEMQGTETGNKHLEGISFQRWDDLPSNESNRNRIEDWLSQIDFQDSLMVPENAECFSPIHKMKEHFVTSSVATRKPEARGSPGMEAAYNYISSLTAISTSAQMANLGLVVIPHLGAFSSLRLLNLAGNSIVRITTGALPRGLHMLNLSKNHISSIEGLRELTRLRVLDLSYNKIMRIGHGLASCSSLRELYLAGNKISEVEGLHRLLKLHVLDLRLNKISTAKCLGQLAANYASLQSINLEGNPAQRNVGDEQIKRCLLSFLPNLIHFNKHIIRNSSKDVPDRSARTFSSHQFDRSSRSDRSMRSEQKRSRRGHHNVALKPSTVSSTAKSSQPVSSLLKQSRGQHAPLPPAATKATHNHLPNIGKLLSLGNPMRRSRSEGNL